mmetsp:Transcript_28170/g.40802  ORF Transcript_28170/g.40802 Transcript_28170/m.40802 type:complete len:137 (+) Transcript_28170:570-980(+)
MPHRLPRLLHQQSARLPTVQPHLHKQGPLRPKPSWIRLPNRLMNGRQQRWTKLKSGKRQKGKFLKPSTKSLQSPKKNNESSLASELAKLTQQSTNMKKQTDEIEAWRVNFDADQQLRFSKQDKKMTKKTKCTVKQV